MEDAKDALKRLIRDELSPRLRRLGFKGSSGTYALDSDQYFAQLGIQRGPYNSPARAQFTVSLSVISHADWADIRQEYPFLKQSKPSPITTYFPDRPWIERLSHLMGYTMDPWWQVLAGQPIEPVAIEVAQAVEEYALPAMRARMQPPA